MVDEQEHPADQLARQWKAAIAVCRNRVYGARQAIALVYLTAHITPPIRDLDDSLAAMRAQGTEPQLFWLSWSALEDPLRDRIALDAEPAAEIARDVLAYLDEASLLRFKGWRLAAGAPAYPGQCWCYSPRAALAYWTNWGANSPLWRYRASGAYGFVSHAPALPLWAYGRKDAAHG